MTAPIYLSVPLKRLKIRQFPLFHNPRSLLFVAMLTHRNQVAELIRSTSILGDEVVDGCLFECERLAALCAETVGLFEDYAFCGKFLLLLCSKDTYPFNAFFYSFLVNASAYPSNLDC